MRADGIVALNIAMAIVSLLFLAGAGIVVTVPVLDAHAPLLLPLLVMAALVATPFAVWALTRGHRPHTIAAL